MSDKLLEVLERADRRELLAFADALAVMYVDLPRDAKEWPALLRAKFDHCASHAFVRLFSGESVDYLKILRRIAHKLDIEGSDDGGSAEDYERAICRKIVESARDEMTEEQESEFDKNIAELARKEAMRQGADLNFDKFLLPAGGAAALLGAKLIGMKIVAGAGGPIGWAGLAALTAWKLGEPNWRKTITAVVIAAAMRERQAMAKSADKRTRASKPPPGVSGIVRKYMNRAAAAIAESSIDEADAGTEKICPGRRPFTWNAIFAFACIVAIAVGYIAGIPWLFTIAVTGLVGYGTNRLAILMLFRPREKRHILPQGIIPRRREDFIKSISLNVERNLLNADIIHKHVQDSGMAEAAAAGLRRKISAMITDEHFKRDAKHVVSESIRSVCESDNLRKNIRIAVDSRVDSYIDGNSILNMFPSLRQSAKDRIMSEILRMLDDPEKLLEHLWPEVEKKLDALPDRLFDPDDAAEMISTAIRYALLRIDLKAAMEGELQKLDAARMEKMVRDVCDNELRYIMLLGGILGCIAGLFILYPARFAIFAGAGILLVLGFDALLHRLWPPDAEELGIAANYNEDGIGDSAEKDMGE